MSTPISFKDQAISAFGKGFLIMGLQTPFVNPLNRISIVSSNTGFSSLKATKEIISGRIDNPTNPKSSFWNLHKGISGHLAKEIPRLSFKPFGAVILKPKIDEAFPSSPLKSSLVFASMMSLMEMVINPFDTIRVRLQAGQPLKTLFPQPIKQLYAGSLGNGARQFGTWGVFNFSGAHLDRFFSTLTTLDTKSFDGMATKSLIQAALLTTTVYPTFERLKNELQYNLSLKKVTSSLYKTTFTNIITKHGVIGLTHGLLPKIFSNAILVYGFNWLVENGKPKPITKYATLQIGSNLFENSLVRISKVKFLPKEEPTLHYNEYQRVLIPLQTGTLAKVDAEGNVVGQREFTRGCPVLSSKTDKTTLHGNINHGEKPLEFLVVEMKKN